jgi:FkbM family methyltransferase
VKEIRPGRLPQPLHLRPSTSDWLVCVDILVRDEYAFPNERYEHGLARLEERLRAAGKTPIIVDCGANIGISAVWFANRFPNATVVAVEPEPRNFDLLERNTAAYPNIVPVRAAVSDRRAHVSLTNDGDAPWSWATREGDDGDIETVTIADLFAQVPNGAPLIVKIDIEGGEVDLFRSATDWTRDTPLIVFEDHDWMLPGKGTFAAVMKRLVDEPRDYFRKGENTFAFSHTLLGETGG